MNSSWSSLDATLLFDGRLSIAASMKNALPKDKNDLNALFHYDVTSQKLVFLDAVDYVS